MTLTSLIPENKTNTFRGQVGSGRLYVTGASFRWSIVMDLKCFWWGGGWAGRRWKHFQNHMDTNSFFPSTQPPQRRTLEHQSYGKSHWGMVPETQGGHSFLGLSGTLFSLSLSLSLFLIFILEKHLGGKIQRWVSAPQKCHVLLRWNARALIWKAKDWVWAQFKAGKPEIWRCLSWFLAVGLLSGMWASTKPVFHLLGASET